VHNVVLANGEQAIASINCSNNHVRSGTGSLFVATTRSSTLVHCDLLRTTGSDLLSCLSVAAVLAVSHSNILDSTAILGSLFVVDASVCEISHSAFARNVFTSIIDGVSTVCFRNCELDSTEPEAEGVSFDGVKFAIRNVSTIDNHVDCDCSALEGAAVRPRAMLLQNDAPGEEFWKRATFPRPHPAEVGPEHDDKDDPVFRYENLQEEPDASGFRLRQTVVQRSDDEGDALPLVHEERIEVQQQRVVLGDDGPWKPKPRRAVKHQVAAE
jgi:hypothetical protein